MDFNKVAKKLKKKLSVFWTVKVVQLLCMSYIAILTFSYAPIGLRDPATGFIIDVNNATNTENGVILVNGSYRPVVADSTAQMIFLAVSRLSAFSLYPMLVLVFFSKCKATLNFLEQAPSTLYMFQDMHELHVYAGTYIAFDVWIHTLFHLMRWGAQGNISLLWTCAAGLTGLIVVVSTPFITFPMLYMKTQIAYEIRKGIHYLFYVFAIVICWHVPVSGIPNGGFIAPVMGFCISLYTLDTLIVIFFFTEKIETTVFHVLPSGVQMTMAVSRQFQDRQASGGFAYVSLPWVDRNQWHAFSLFENPNEPSKRAVFMLKTGDWTHAVHDALQRNTVRPVWVQGPFASPYNNASSYDNQILVASGIGITPALSVIRAQKQSRRVNLIWACRDNAMLEFFLEHFELDDDGWNLIFYTGKSPLNPGLMELQANVKIIKKRPDLYTAIPNIIYGIESGNGLPESCERTSEEVKELIVMKLETLDKDSKMGSTSKLAELTKYAQTEGFSFTELLEEERLMKKEQEMPASNNTGSPARASTLGRTPTIGRNAKLVDLSKYARAKTVEPDDDFAMEETGKSQANMSADAPMDADRILERIRGLRAEIEAARTGSVNPTSSIPEGDEDMGVFEPWVKNTKAQEYVKGLNQEVIESWGILYCGGSKPVEVALHAISEEYMLGLATESFAW
mmetsp:Transcript_28716/g.80835  ORF Transcript_28716/g.80835 Transcript_28716/m.80835 type:complete len:680 (+) Transcript_28716:174-2213(+)|eukprot:CAMPEP_0117677018 /NCGR_PEP_ID=MMETSP0804-20121206/16520_1 /TAXON_ID=1074897 /ORGANISM="Tetraselmis astigmatica, Strain CCMP880" /LENGTH=679 /DNA_ID=CAMNT_0005486271 /DNA_START=68 /DNA_END=2107 /DNA_ORIENTATION=-